MAYRIIHESPAGQLIRILSGKRFFKYPEEEPDFQLPPQYVEAMNPSVVERKSRPASSASTSTTESPTDIEGRDAPETDAAARDHQLEKLETAPVETKHHDDHVMQRTKSIPIAPVKTNEGIILVDFYATDDPSNPQNWSPGTKLWVAVVICLYTFVVYCGSAIYVSSSEGVMRRFGVNHIEASLPLALYVLSYGIGPIVFAPLSEIPSVGRSPVYAVTMALFVLFSFGPPLVQTFGGLLVFRFLQGFFGSPCLATGGASLQDIFSLLYLPYALS